MISICPDFRLYEIIQGIFINILSDRFDIAIELQASNFDPLLALFTVTILY